MSSDTVVNYAVGDVVWAKVKGYPYWPAKISEPKSSEHMKRSQKNNSKGPKECFVQFFGCGLSLAWVHHKEIVRFDCPKKEEFIKKAEKLPKLMNAVNEANTYVQNPLGVASNDGKAGDTETANTSDQLMSIDDELKLIKGTEETAAPKAEPIENGEKEQQKRKSKSPKTPKVAKKKVKKEADVENNEPADETPARQSSQRRRNTRLSVQVDQLCTPGSKTSDEMDKSVKKEDVLTENGNVPAKKKSTTKRAYSNDTTHEDNGEQSESEHKKKLSTDSYKVKAFKPLPTKYTSFTLVTDYSMPDLMNKIIESFLTCDIDLYVHCIDSEKGIVIDEKYKTCRHFNLVDDLETALRKDVVFVFLDSTHHEDFDKKLYSYALNNVRLVNFSPQSYKDAVFCHHYFNDNNGFFVEAPLLLFGANQFKIYASSIDSKFFESIKPVLDLLPTSEIVYKKSSIGIPSLLVTMFQSAIEESQRLAKNTLDKIENVFQTDETIRKYKKSDTYDEFAQTMGTFFKSYSLREFVKKENDLSK